MSGSSGSGGGGGARRRWSVQLIGDHRAGPRAAPPCRSRCSAASRYMVMPYVPARARDPEGPGLVDQEASEMSQGKGGGGGGGGRRRRRRRTGGRVAAAASGRRGEARLDPDRHDPARGDPRQDRRHRRQARCIRLRGGGADASRSAISRPSPTSSRPSRCWRSPRSPCANIATGSTPRTCSSSASTSRPARSSGSRGRAISSGREDMLAMSFRTPFQVKARPG